MKQKLPRYDFTKPIRIIQYKSPRFDLIFYSALFTALVTAIIALICIHDGTFEIRFVTWRVLLCIPLILLAVWMRELLNELRIYPKQLMKKHTWKIEELMEMTGKDREAMSWKPVSWSIRAISAIHEETVHLCRCPFVLRRTAIGPG